MIPTLPQSRTGSFANELSDRIQEFRSALVRMLAELGSPKSASDLLKLTGAGYTICWRVFRIVNASELAAESRHAPSPSALKRLLAAASSAGATQNAIEAVQIAAQAFEDFSKRAAGDQSARSFDLVFGASPRPTAAESVMTNSPIRP